MNNKFRVCIDADGVTFDYRASYPIVWKKAFGTDLHVVNHNSYHAHIMYGIDFSKDKEMEKEFFSHFTEEIWANLPPCPGAVEACRMLHNLGAELICVSSMPNEFEGARQSNFNKLDMPISQVIATGRIRGQNPKMDVVHDLKPVVFVDDLATNFLGINEEIHRALIQGDHHDNPNKDHHHLATTLHPDLLTFANYWKQCHFPMLGASNG